MPLNSVEGIQVQPRDVTLLCDLFESRVMTLAHVAALHFDGKDEAAKKRIQKLKAAKFIAERPRRVHEPSVLFLARTGLNFLSAEGHLQRYPSISLTTLEKRAQVSQATLRHELEVMDVKAAITTAVTNLPNFKVVEFSTWPLLYEFRAFRPDGEAVTVKPDGFIRIEEEDADGLAEHTFFLEVDRSTEPLDTLWNRAQCYLDFYRRGGLAVRNGRPKEEYKEFPFRVLLVCKSGERRDIVAKRLLNGNPPILTQVWLTCVKDLIAEPIGSVWVHPNDFQTKNLAKYATVEKRPMLEN